MPVGDAQVWVSQESLREMRSVQREGRAERKEDAPEAVSADVDRFECHAGGVASECEAEEVPRSWLPGEEGRGELSGCGRAFR